MLVKVVTVVEVLEATDSSVLLGTVARQNRWNNGFMIVPLCQKATIQWLLRISIMSWPSRPCRYAM